MATCSECVRRLFRHKVNKSIYEMLYRAVGFGVSVAVPTIKCEDDAVYFDLKFASYHDLGPGRYADAFTGVIVGRSGTSSTGCVNSVTFTEDICGWLRNILT